MPLGESVKLREFKLSDAERVADLVGDKAVSDWTANIPYPYEKSDAVEWIDKLASNNDGKSYAVEKNDEIVGCVSYWHLGVESIEVGYWVGKDYWGQGIGSESLHLMLSSSVFPVVPNVFAKIMKGNTGSERVLLNNGFEFAEECVFTKQGREIHGCLYVKVKKA